MAAATAWGRDGICPTSSVPRGGAAWEENMTPVLGHDEEVASLCLIMGATLALRETRHSHTRGPREVRSYAEA